MKLFEVIPLYLEYVEVAPIFEVLAEADARAAKPRDPEEDDIIGEQIAEIASERALDGSRTAMSDARRIWTFQNRVRALEDLARNAPRHAEVAHDFIRGLDI